jgi:NAD(P)-dependent dehydrogenase (short-subunit alcohol dehydrogenase family)
LGNDDGSLAGRVAVVTGAGSGIGRATAVELSGAGASLVLAGRTEASLNETAALTGAQTRVVVADVSIAADVRRVVEEAVAAFGTVDVLVNNAGIEGPVAPVHEYPEEDFDRVMAVNVKGTFLCLRAVLPLMLERGSGSIVNLSSVAGERGLQGTAAYIASKHAVLGLTRNAAAEVAGMGIRVNAICAGMVDTRMLRTLCAAYMPDDVGTMLAAVAASAPIARLAEPEEIARVVRFLASDESSFVNGAAWAVDGGALGTMGGRWD